MAIEASAILPSDSLEEFRVQFNNLVVDVEGVSGGNAFVSTIIFEGSTADANETVILATDPTSDNTLTLPDATGTFLTTANSGDPATTTSASDADHVLVNDGGVLKKITRANLGIGGTAGAVAVDDLTVGDAAVSIATSAGNITIDAQGGNTDIIFKGTDGSSDITPMTLDMSDAGALLLTGGKIDLKNSGTASQILFYCESSNQHAQTLIGAPHSEAASNTLTLPSGSSGVLLSTVSTATVTNKTLTAPVINTATVGTSITPASDDGATLGSANLNWSDLFLADAAVIKLGDDQDVTLTHVHGTGILLNSTNVIQFNDASQNIGAPSNAILDINATDEIELNATLVDINANVEISGTAEITGIATFTDDIVIGDGKTIGSASAATAITIASTGIVSFVDDILIKNGGTIGSAGDADSIAIASNGVVTFSQIPVMPANSIDSDEYIDGSIDPEHLADNAVTLAKMASGTDGNIISYDASGNPVAIATGSDGQVLTSAGAGAQPAFEDAGGGTGAAFYVTSNAAQTIQHATATKVAFQVEGVDGDSLFSSNRFTPDTAGNYLLTTTILFGTIPTDTKYGNVEIRKNNQNDFSTTIGHFSSGDRAGISCTVFLPANGTGDYFEVFVYHIKGSAGNLYNACAFGGFKI